MGSLETPAVKGPQSQQKVWSGGSVTDRMAPGWSDRKVSVTFET